MKITFFLVFLVAALMFSSAVWANNWQTSGGRHARQGDCNSDGDCQPGQYCAQLGPTRYCIDIKG